MARESVTGGWGNTGHATRRTSLSHTYAVTARFAVRAFVVVENDPWPQIVADYTSTALCPVLSGVVWVDSIGAAPVPGVRRYHDRQGLGGRDHETQQP